MATLAEIRERLRAEASRRENAESGNRTQQASVTYPHWTLLDGKESTVRFLPDGDPNNMFFWVEKQMINLVFAGVLGEDENKEISVQVPCVEMYGKGNICPIINEIRPWWNDKSLEDMARKYWKKRSYLLQGFVITDGLDEQLKPENLIRRFTVTPQVFKPINKILLDDDLDDIPTDYVNGLDFKIKRGTVGKWADYSQSDWSRKTRPLNEVELEAIEKHGLFDLKEALPTKPTAEDLILIKEMFEASIAGELFDASRWGKFRPTRQNNNNNNTTPDTVQVQPVAQVQVQQPVVEVQAETTPWDEPATAAVPVQPSAAQPATSKAADILSQIRSRAVANQ